MGATCSSGMRVPAYSTTRRHKPEDPKTSLRTCFWVVEASQGHSRKCPWANKQYPNVQLRNYKPVSYIANHVEQRNLEAKFASIHSLAFPQGLAHAVEL
jgi:hypothetical protein